MKISIKGDQYPPLLRQIYNAPRQLFYEGDLEITNKLCLGVVGTRTYSDYGKFITEKIVSELAVLDVAIISGLAKGIDTIAHKAAIKNNLSTIAVLGSGLNNIYPPQNQKLAEEIKQKGLLLSEYEPEIEPNSFHFPQRNRIVSGLCAGIIVIEAPERSGALITAKLALDQGREIFAVPGDIDRENSTGTLRLLQKSGAYPISSGYDVIEVLKSQPHLFNIERLNQNHKAAPKKKAKLPINLNEDEKLIFNQLNTRQPKSFEEIKNKLNIETAKILSILSILEIKNLIKTKDGKYLTRC